MNAPPTRPTVLCAAFSARQIAASAARAGYGALAVDFFGDLDLRETALRGETLSGGTFDGFDGDRVLEALGRLSEGHDPVGFVHGAGFEDRPELLDEIGERWPLLGTPPQTQRLLKDPETFAGLCRSAGVMHPEIAIEAPADDRRSWVSKAKGGCGGGHVRPATDASSEAGRYVQRYVAGERWSAAFLAAGGKALVLGFTRQWTDPSPDEPFRYGGAVGPIAPPEPAGTVMRDAVSRMAAAVQDSGGPPLAGLCSADFILSTDGPVLLEVNARFGATVDVFDTEAAPLFALHLAACRGALETEVRGPRTVRASGLVWARGPITVPAGCRWPAFTRDRTALPARFLAGQPIATIVAEADNAETATERFEAYRRELLSTFERKVA